MSWLRSCGASEKSSGTPLAPPILAREAGAGGLTFRACIAGYRSGTFMAKAGVTRTGLAQLRREAAGCQRCDLWKRGTQTVFGEGATGELMLVGEQPGDAEDLAGRPFVGPAGTLLRKLLEEARIAEDRVYVTNAVKHFKWRPAGKRRIHDKPNWTEIGACSHWLEREFEAVQPRLVVCLGATATQALLGRSARVGALRGRRLELDDGTPALVTGHPSAVLRAGEDRAIRRAELLQDLQLARKTLDQLVAAS